MKILNITAVGLLIAVYVFDTTVAVAEQRISGTTKRYVVRAAESLCPGCTDPLANCAFMFDRCPTVADAEIVAGAGNIAGTEKQVTACGCVGPESGCPLAKDLQFAPEVIGEHKVRIKHIDCFCHCDRLECTYWEEGQIYDVDPAKPFEIAADLDAQTALEIFRLYSAGKTVGVKIDKETLAAHPQVTYVERRGEQYWLEAGGCAGGLGVLIKLEQSADERVLRVLDWGIGAT